MLLRFTLLPLAAAGLLIAGCTSGSMNITGTQSNAVTGSTFVVGTDAPLAAVTSFQVQLESVELIPTPTSSGSPVSMISGTPTVDFARFNGLQTLLDMNDAPVGTYGSVQITLNSTGTIGYLNTGSGAPTIATMTANISPATVTITLNKPLKVVHGASPVGLRVDFDLAQSIQVSGGAITGNVNPTFDVRAVANTDNGGYIDEFIAGVVSVNQTGQSFVVQGPHGENFTVDVNGQTEWDGDASLAALATDGTNAIVQVSGKLDPADQTLDADEVAILTDSGFYATGQITYVTPPPPATGAATNFDLYVRGLEPTNTGLTLGQIAHVSLGGSEKYFIYWMHNPFTQFLFNSSALTAGQAVAVGGPAAGAANASDVTVKRIHLRNWGLNGTIVKGSQSAANGSFQMQVNGFAGVLIPNPITVYLGAGSDFRYGFGAFHDLDDGANVRVVGLLLKNPTTGQVVLLARHIDGLNFTDFTTAAWQ
jgi:hypothetical protein